MQNLHVHIAGLRKNGEKNIPHLYSGFAFLSRSEILTLLLFVQQIKMTFKTSVCSSPSSDLLQYSHAYLPSSVLAQLRFSNIRLVPPTYRLYRGSLHIQVYNVLCSTKVSLLRENKKNGLSRKASVLRSKECPSLACSQSCDSVTVS